MKGNLTCYECSMGGKNQQCFTCQYCGVSLRYAYIDFFEPCDKCGKKSAKVSNSGIKEEYKKVVCACGNRIRWMSKKEWKEKLYVNKAM